MGCSWHIPEAFTESQKPQREANQKKMPAAPGFQACVCNGSSSDSSSDSFTMCLLMGGALPLSAVGIIGPRRERAVGGVSYLVLVVTPPPPLII